MYKKNQDVIVAVFLLVMSMATRLIPHVDNFSFMESAVLFGAAYFYRKIWAFLLPIVAMYCVDFVINNTVARSFFPDIKGLVWFSDYMIYNALAYLLIAFAGTSILKKVTMFRVFSGALTASVIFYIVTNFGSWADPKSIYPGTLNGLGLSYLAGIPFFRTSLISTLVFSGILFFLFDRLYQVIFKTNVIAR